jgi:hypothetical protein
MMTDAQIRLNQNPVLTQLLLGLGQGDFIGEALFPRLPQALSGMQLANAGDAHMRLYDLKRAPGAATKKINIDYSGTTYTIKNYSVDIPIPREKIRESQNGARLNLTGNLELSRIAMSTASAVLALGYEYECALAATTSGNFAGQVTALSAGAKWSASTGTPVTDILAAAEVIRKKTGKRPNTLTLSADAAFCLKQNAEVRGYLPANQMGPATMDQLKTILNVERILMGDGIYLNDAGTAVDMWGNNAILSYVPKMGGANGDINMAEPAFGFTSVMEGHPFAESPRYDGDSKSWIYGATFERSVNIATPAAGYLFQNPK